ncbi:MAG: class I SAM-dependent methyltransferase, partial [Sphingomicrobium sp.]
MSVIGKLVDKLLKRGSITLITPGGKRETYGPGGGKALTVRFTDNRVGFDILKNPRLGVGEAYMDGRLVVEDGTILDLLELVTGSNRWEDAGQKRKLFAKKRLGALKALLRRNDPRQARRNVAHHYDLSDELYDAFLDPDRQYSCAYYTDPRNSL